MGIEHRFDQKMRRGKKQSGGERGYHGWKEYAIKKKTRWMDDGLKDQKKSRRFN